MLNALFVDKTGMLAQQRRLETASNNLANLNTVGFKKEKIFFRQLIDAMADPLADDANRAPGATQTDFTTGHYKTTGNPLDVAIAGDGFFVIDTGEGEYYTRNGGFRLDSDGVLVTHEGFPVSTDGGELQISGQNVRITEGGDVVVDGVSVGKLRVVRFQDPQLLEKHGMTHYRSGEAGPADVPPEEINLRAGVLELSNVEPIQEMINMIEINRQFELGQRSINTLDETLDKLINQAARF